MEADKVKQSIALIMISTVTLLSLRKIFNTIVKKNNDEYDLSSDSFSSDSYTSSNSSNEFDLTSSSNQSSELVSESNRSGSPYKSRFYITKTNVVINKDDEIVGRIKSKDNDISVDDSFGQIEDQNQQNENNNERNYKANEFFQHLTDVKDKAVKLRLFEDKKHKSRKKSSKVGLQEDSDSISMLESEYSSDDENLQNLHEYFEADTSKSKNLKEKFEKERAMIKLLKGKNKPQKIKKVRKLQRNVRCSKTDLELNSKDFDHKSDYIFFEVLASYADAFLERPEGRGSDLQKLISKKQLRRH